jgi:hypothetical protein
MIREDFGEARTRILLLIDVRSWSWGVGVGPNTLAHIQLRLATSLLLALLRSGVATDVAICSELMPKVVLYQGEGFEAVAYRVFSVLDASKGCESPVEVFIEALKYMGKSTSSYKPSP